MCWVELHRMLNSGSFLTHRHCMTIALAIDPESIYYAVTLYLEGSDLLQSPTPAYVLYKLK